MEKKKRRVKKKKKDGIIIIIWFRSFSEYWLTIEWVWEMETKPKKIVAWRYLSTPEPEMSRDLQKQTTLSTSTFPRFSSTWHAIHLLNFLSPSFILLPLTCHYTSRISQPKFPFVYGFCCYYSSKKKGDR